MDDRSPPIPFDALPDAVLLVDRDGRILAANRSARKLFDRTAADLAGTRIEELLILPSAGGGPQVTLLRGPHVADDSPLFTRTLGRTRQGKPFSCEAAVGVTSRDSANAQWVVTVRNAVYRARESQREKSLDMTAVTDVIGLVANELNNQLTAISGNLESAWRSTQGRGGPGVRELAAAYEANRKAARIAWRLAALTTTAPMVQRVTDPERLVRDAILAMQQQEPRNVTIRTEFNHDGWRVRADASQIAEVLSGCCQNAVDAMPGGGLLTISTHCAAGASGEPTPTPDQPQGEYVRFDIADTGHGISSEDLPHIFDPFFTTKDASYGLGLAGANGVLRAHGGRMTVDSRTGAGTTFHIFLPRTLDDIEPTHAAEAGAKTATGETVLIIDDEAVVRQTTRAALEYCGFRVLEACDGEDGLTLWREHRDELALVILDVQMPKKSGWEVLTILRQEHSTLPVILVSGYPAGGGRSPDELPAPDAFLRKPYELFELVQTAQSLLSSDEEPGRTG